MCALLVTTFFYKQSVQKIAGLLVYTAILVEAGGGGGHASLLAVFFLMEVFLCE